MWRRLLALGWLPTLLVGLAMLATGAMYAGNDLADKDPAAARGDGRYRPLMARGDGHMHFLITRSLVLDRDVDFDNDLARFGDPWNQPRTRTGRKLVMQQIGPSLIWAPLLVVAHGAALVANLGGADIAPHGYTMFHQRILFASSVVFAWLAVGLGLVLARRLAGGRWAPAWAAVAVLLGTPLTYYATFMPSYAHAMDAAVTAGFLALWIATRGELAWRRFAWLGALLALAMLVRPQNVLTGGVLLVELVPRAWALVRARAPGTGRALLGLAGRGALVLGIALAAQLPQLLAWHQMFGVYVATPQGPGYVRSGHPMVLELLFSSRNGWLSTHPIAYLGVIGLAVGVVRGTRLGPHVRGVCGALLLVVAAQVYVNACVLDWWSSASFGQRRLCSMTLPLVVGLAVLLRAVSTGLARRLPTAAKLGLVAVVLGYLVAWNLAWVSRLAAATPAGRDDLPTCCDVPRPLAWVARPIYAAVGNPFELPASAVFAVRHGVDLRRWDRTVGVYPLVPPFLGFIDGSYRRAVGTWDLIARARFVLGGFGPTGQGPGRRWRWTTAPRAQALLPLLVPEPHRITIPMAANAAPGETVPVEVWWNDRRVARVALGAAWTDVVFDTDAALGEGTVTIVSEVRPPRITGTAALPAPMVPVGVAVGTWRIGFTSATLAR